MFLTSKSLPRRTVLRGLGATLALPFLDAMTPAMALRVAARARSRRIGSSRSTCRTAWRWSTGRRKAKGSAFELSPILQPLEPFRNQMLVLSGISRQLGRDSRRRLRRVSHRHAARRQDRDRNLRRHVDGPAARQAPRRRKRRSRRSRWRWIRRPTRARAPAI